LPLPLADIGTVQLEDTFLVTGGYDISQPFSELPFSANVYWFDADEEEWVLAPQKLPHGRAYHAAFVVPEGYFNCSS